MAALREFIKKQERELPRLPVPALQQTLHRYLQSVKPFLTNDELKVTQRLVQEFGAPHGVGEKLQKLLQEKAARTINWLADWWINVAYLSCRTPLPVYSSTSALWPPVELSLGFNQLNLAAAATAAFLDFKTLLEENKIPAERMGPYELDMSQFEYVYSTCRLPGEHVDSIQRSEPSRHITVAHNNHFFIVPVYDEAGNLLNQKQLLSQLKKVVDQSRTPSSTPIGILTTENRTVWYKARKSLLEASAENRKNLDLIESSLFFVALDAPLSQEELAKKGQVDAAADRAMHGSVSHSANRWFDLMNQFIVSGSGELALTTEHTPGEAHPIISDHIHVFWTTLRGQDSVKPAGKFKLPQKLQFVVPEDVKTAIEQAFVSMKSLSASIDLRSFTYVGYGKNFIRSLKIGSVDSYIQMALQLTFYRLHNVPAAQYESATTRAFVGGRTDTIRSCSVESVHFVRTMLDASVSDKDKRVALRVAMQTHKDCIMNAMTGQGIDRHLLGLRLIAAENGIEMPKLFQDPGFTRSSYMRLSTSQVPSVCNGWAFFGPLVVDGYGCCYNPHAQDIECGISAYNLCPETSAAKFCEALEQSLNEMKQLMASALPLEKL